jgi:hypothetical protein
MYTPVEGMSRKEDRKEGRKGNPQITQKLKSNLSNLWMALRETVYRCCAAETASPLRGTT